MYSPNETKGETPPMSNLENNLWKHFKEIVMLAHGSGKEDPVREYIKNFADGVGDVQVKFYQQGATTPGQRVIAIKKHPDRQSRFILQGHLDMVCVPPDMEFPLSLVEDGVWINAREKGGRPSTLGADNGIGVAAALALLESEYPHGYECFFTVEEETTMGGARDFDPALLEARTLINVDSEDVNTITYGCAGGIETLYNLPFLTVSVPAGRDDVTVKIFGLTGGHSGADINKGRLNAIKVLNQCLRHLDLKYDFNLVSFAGGSAKNAIPTDATAEVIVKQQDTASFIQDFNAICLELKKINQTVEPGFDYNASQGSLPTMMLDTDSSRRVLEMLFALPQGVIKMDPDNPGMVITSNNMGLVNTTADGLSVCCFHRSSSQAEIDRVSKNLETIGCFYNAEWRHENGFPPWTPNPESPILQITKDVYGPGATVEVTHGGLECSYFYQKFEMDSKGKMDCVSIGPTILDPHSTKERVNKETVTIFLDRLSQILDRL